MSKDNRKPTKPQNASGGKAGVKKSNPEKGAKQTPAKAQGESVTNTGKKDVKHKYRHNLDEIEDNFEEFETASDRASNNSQSDVNDRVTIWMNSWMDDDDGDVFTSNADPKRRL